MEYFKYWGNIITKNVRRTREIKARTEIRGSNIQNRMKFLPENWTYIYGKKLVKSYIWSIVLKGV